MDNRLIFLYRRVAVMSNGGTQEGRRSRPLVVPVQARREISEANPGGYILRGDGEGNSKYRTSRSHAAKKNL
jgi:hypothetical protein